MNMNVLMKLKTIKECYSRALLTGVYPAVEFAKTLLETAFIKATCHSATALLLSRSHTYSTVQKKVS